MRRHPQPSLRRLDSLLVPTEVLGQGSLVLMEGIISRHMEKMIMEEGGRPRLFTEVISLRMGFHLQGSLGHLSSLLVGNQGFPVLLVTESTGSGDDITIESSKLKKACMKRVLMHEECV